MKNESSILEYIFLFILKKNIHFFD